jgi:hypothetical protein
MAKDDNNITLYLDSMMIPLIGLQSTNSFHRNRFNQAHFYFDAL